MCKFGIRDGVWRVRWHRRYRRFFFIMAQYLLNILGRAGSDPLRVLSIQDSRMNTPPSESKLLIFTDLDGSLLDHHDYRFEPAAALLQKLNFLNIPVIPATSKTEAELLHLRSTLANEHPFIAENGAAVFIPKGYFPEPPEGTTETGDFRIKEFTEPREHWLSLIARTGADRADYKTFSEATVTDIIELTGLEQDAAVRASRRHYGEPLAWLGGDGRREQFVFELRQLGANVMQGGRFLHVSGNCDKGKALKWLVDQYKNVFLEPILTVAVGDGQNDIAMLEAADMAVLIPSPAHDLPVLNKSQRVYVASSQGPQGWAESITMILERLPIQ